jgi:hypothetical protein
MTPREAEIENLLSAPHQIAWDIGRHDPMVLLIRSINLLRGYVVRPVPDTRDDDELDRAEEALAHGVSVRDLNDLNP